MYNVLIVVTRDDLELPVVLIGLYLEPIRRICGLFFANVEFIASIILLVDDKFTRISKQTSYIVFPQYQTTDITTDTTQYATNAQTPFLLPSLLPTFSDIEQCNNKYTYIHIYTKKESSRHPRQIYIKAFKEDIFGITLPVW